MAPPFSDSRARCSWGRVKPSSVSWRWASLMREGVTVHLAFAPTVRNTWPSPQKAKRTARVSKWLNSPGKVAVWAGLVSLGGGQFPRSLILFLPHL